MTLRHHSPRLLALLLCLSLVLAALAMVPMTASATSVAPGAHATHALHPATQGVPDTGAPRDLACAIGCAGSFDPAPCAPLAGPAGRLFRLPRLADAPPPAGRAPAPIDHPPRRSTLI